MIPAGDLPEDSTDPRYLFRRAFAAELDFFLSGFVVLSPMILLEVDPHGSDLVSGLTILAIGLVMLAASAAFVAFNNGSTPGKAFFGLRVAGISSFRAALRREALRLGPCLAIFGFMHAQASTSPSLPDPWPAVGALLALAALIGMFWYGVLPFFALNGDFRARWDKRVGSRVEHRSDYSRRPD